MEYLEKLQHLIDKYNLTLDSNNSWRLEVQVSVGKTSYRSATYFTEKQLMENVYIEEEIQSCIGEMIKIGGNKIIKSFKEGGAI